MLCAQDILRSCFAVHQRGKLWEAARRRLDSKTFEDLKRRLVLHWSSGYIAVVGGVVCKKKNMFITSTKHDLSSSKHEHVSFEHVLSFATWKSSWKYLQTNKPSSRHWKGYMYNLLYAICKLHHCSLFPSFWALHFRCRTGWPGTCRSWGGNQASKATPQNEEIFLWLSNIFHMFPSCSVLFHHFFADFPIFSQWHRRWPSKRLGSRASGSCCVARLALIDSCWRRLRGWHRGERLEGWTGAVTLW